MSFASTTTDDDRAQVLADLAAARAALAAVRRGVARRMLGASELHAAEHRHHVAMERARKLGVLDDEPQDAA